MSGDDTNCGSESRPARRSWPRLFGSGGLGSVPCFPPMLVGSAIDVDPIESCRGGVSATIDVVYGTGVDGEAEYPPPLGQKRYTWENGCLVGVETVTQAGGSGSAAGSAEEEINWCGADGPHRPTSPPPPPDPTVMVKCCESDVGPQTPLPATVYFDIIDNYGAFPVPPCQFASTWETGPHALTYQANVGTLDGVPIDGWISDVIVSETGGCAIRLILWCPTTEPVPGEGGVDCWRVLGQWAGSTVCTVLADVVAGTGAQLCFHCHQADASTTVQYATPGQPATFWFSIHFYARR